MIRRLLLCLLFVLAVLSPARAQSDGEEGPDERAYQVEIQGIDGALKDKVAASSRLVSLASRPAPGRVALAERARGDNERIDAVLRGEGFYDGTVAIGIDRAADPVRVTVRIDPGPPTLLSAWDAGPGLLIEPGQVALTLGVPARAEAIVDAAARALRVLAERGHPLARSLGREAVVDHRTRSMTVVERIDPGPKLRFGAVAIEGETGVDESWIRNRIPWQRGEDYDPAKVESLRFALSGSGLFQSARVSLAETADEDGTLPIMISATARKSRTIGAGALYSTSEGPTVQAFWEDRNFLGGAERLRLSGSVGTARSLLIAGLRAPDTYGVGRDSVSEASFERRYTSTFQSTTIGASSGIEWQVSPTWSLAGSLAYEHDIAKEAGERERAYDLVSLPLRARHDTTDSLLDPSRGTRTTLSARPYQQINGGQAQFTRLMVEQTGYVRLSQSPRAVLALWADAGTYLGGETFDLPADKRFYAGGGGSVRAYKLYYAGPLNDAGQPAGGRSTMGYGTELRLNVTDDIGVVPFVEGASVSSSTLPPFGDRPYWGGGLGLRYNTTIGPIRFDLAVPFRRRNGIDDSFQIYVSLGQAF